MELPNTKGMTYATRLSVLMALRDPPPKRKELAEVAEVTVQAIGDLLRGKTKHPSTELNLRLAKYFGVTPEYLYSGEDDRPPPQTLQQTQTVQSSGKVFSAQVASEAMAEFRAALPERLRQFLNKPIPLGIPRRKPRIADYYSGQVWAEIKFVPPTGLSGRPSAPDIAYEVLDMIQFRQMIYEKTCFEHFIFITDLPAVMLHPSVESACSAWNFRIHTVKTASEAAELVAYLEQQAAEYYAQADAA
jgi:transcriptional regulator with XRE-family HTH domain